MHACPNGCLRNALIMKDAVSSLLSWDSYTHVLCPDLSSDGLFVGLKHTGKYPNNVDISMTSGCKDSCSTHPSRRVDIPSFTAFPIGMSKSDNFWSLTALHVIMFPIQCLWFWKCKRRKSLHLFSHAVSLNTCATFIPALPGTPVGLNPMWLPWKHLEFPPSLLD